MIKTIEVDTDINKVMVILDRAHGINTPGKGSPWTLNRVPPELPFREWEYSKEIIKRLRKVLEDSMYFVYEDVTEDTDIKLAERGRRINKTIEEAKKQDVHCLSISIHNNAAGKGDKWKSGRGWSVWTTPGQNNSDKLAQCLYDAAKEILVPLGQKTRHDRSDGDDDYEANFAMCRMPNCPAVLTENLFQDNPSDVAFLKSEEGMNAIVEIHKRGIDAFVKMMGWPHRDIFAEQNHW